MCVSVCVCVCEIAVVLKRYKGTELFRFSSQTEMASNMVFNYL